MNHQPYGLAGSLSAKVKGFMGLPRSPNVVMRKVISGYQSEPCPTATTTPRPDSEKGSGRSWRMFSFSERKLTRGLMQISCLQGRKDDDY